MLADAQAVEDFRLLIKLSCGASYVQEGDVRLSVAIRLRLAFWANAFEFVDCVQECLQSLSEEQLAVGDALSLLEEMPEELWEHEAAMALREKLIKVLMEAVDEELSATVMEVLLGSETLQLRPENDAYYWLCA